MKRSNEVIRNILILVEEAPSIADGIHQHFWFDTSDKDTFWLTRPGTDRDSVIYNWKLVIDERLVEGEIDESGAGELGFVFADLTWSGHDFLDTIRQEPIWEEMNRLAVKNGIDIRSATYDLLWRLATKAAEIVVSGG